MSERFEIYIVYKRRYINTLPFLSFAKRFALVAGARTYHIQAVRSDIQMSQRLSIAVSVWTTPASRWRWVKAEAAIVINFSTGCDDPRSATAPLLSPRRAHGTVCLTHCTDCHHWNNSRNLWKLIYLKSHLRNTTVCDCKALLKRLVLPTVLYKLSTLYYITLHYQLCSKVTFGFVLLVTFYAVIPHQTSVQKAKVFHTSDVLPVKSTASEH